MLRRAVEPASFRSTFQWKSDRVPTARVLASRMELPNIFIFFQPKVPSFLDSLSEPRYTVAIEGDWFLTGNEKQLGVVGVSGGRKPISPGRKPIFPGRKPISPGRKPISPGRKPISEH